VWTLTAATASVTRRCACDRQSARVPSHPSSATTTATQLQASGTYVCSCCSWPGPRHGALLVSRSVAPSCREQRDAVAPPSHCLTVHRARDEMDPVSKATQIGKYGYSGHILNVRANSKHACQHGTGTVGTAADQVDDADRCPTFGARKNEKGTVIWADGKNVYTTLISSSGQPSSGISKLDGRATGLLGSSRTRNVPEVRPYELGNGGGSIATPCRRRGRLRMPSPREFWRGSAQRQRQLRHWWRWHTIQLDPARHWRQHSRAHHGQRSRHHP